MKILHKIESLGNEENRGEKGEEKKESNNGDIKEEKKEERVENEDIYRTRCLWTKN